MPDPRGRVEHPVRTAQLPECLCATPIVGFAGDPEPPELAAGSAISTTCRSLERGVDAD